MLLMAHTGEAGERAVAPFRSLAPPISDMVGPMRYSEMFQFTEGGPPIKEEVATSLFLDEVSDSAAAGIVEHLEVSNAPIAVSQLRVLGGAAADVDPGATAFAHRHRPIVSAVGVVYDDPDEAGEHSAWVTSLAGRLRSGEPGVYVGFLGDEGDARVRRRIPARPGTDWRRSRRAIDPDNLFRLNQNIPPARGRPGEAPPANDREPTWTVSDSHYLTPYIYSVCRRRERSVKAIVQDRFGLPDVLECGTSILRRWPMARS